jgi:hypothetical protein
MEMKKTHYLLGVATFLLVTFCAAGQDGADKNVEGIEFHNSLRVGGVSWKPRSFMKMMLGNNHGSLRSTSSNEEEDQVCLASLLMLGRLPKEESQAQACRHSDQR